LNSASSAFLRLYALVVVNCRDDNSSSITPYGMFSYLNKAAIDLVKMLCISLSYHLQDWQLYGCQHYNQNLYSAAAGILLSVQQQYS
jgi:hypothetical protein